MAREFILHEEILIRAPIARCFQLSTNIAIVKRELRMTPIRGHTKDLTTGRVSGGDTIRWEGWQLGLPQHHESFIEAFTPPTFFRDRMIAGRFRTFEHNHAFTALDNGTVRLHDELRFTMPFGILGSLIGAAILATHIQRIMQRRFQLLKRIAETSEWQQYLPASHE
jgi:ligand-binding SRPBCC domain-containing protein